MRVLGPCGKIFVLISVSETSHPNSIYDDNQFIMPKKKDATRTEQSLEKILPNNNSIDSTA